MQYGWSTEVHLTIFNRSIYTYSEEDVEWNRLQTKRHPPQAQENYHNDVEWSWYQIFELFQFCISFFQEDGPFQEETGAKELTEIQPIGSFQPIKPSSSILGDGVQLSINRCIIASNFTIIHRFKTTLNANKNDDWDELCCKYYYIAIWSLQFATGYNRSFHRSKTPSLETIGNEVALAIGKIERKEWQWRKELAQPS